MKLSEVVSGISAVRQDAHSSLEISGIAYDSRRVKPGYIFAAIPGYKLDGHFFIPHARANGAVAALTGHWIDDSELPQIQTENVRLALARAAGNFYGHPSNNMTVLGVTGTNGKTTTTFLIDSILREENFRTGLLGGVEYRLGNKTLAAKRTTPESLDLQEMLCEIDKASIEMVTMEVSSHGIDMFRVAYVDFDVAVFTNLTPEHLDLHEDMESYFLSKQRLFMGGLESETGADARGRRPAAVINVDDAYGRRLAEELDGVIGFGLTDYAAVQAVNVQLLGWETLFDLVTPQGTVQIKLRLPGLFNVYNALAAAAAAIALDIPLEGIIKGIKSVEGIPGRFELVNVKAPFNVVVDYAHNEDGLAQSLKTASQLTDNRLIVVFGCPGERDRDKRPQMAEVAGSLSDLAILTTDDCYGEPPERILDEAEPGLKASGSQYLRIPDRRQAIKTAIEAAGSGDTILIAGKGHETTQIMAGGPVPFDDKQVVREIIGV